MTVDPDDELGRPTDLIHLDIGRATNLPYHGRYLIGLNLELVEILTEDLDGKFRSHTFEKFIDIHFNRLREVGQNAGDVAEFLTDNLLDVVLGAGGSPFGLRMQQHKNLGTVDGVGVSAHLTAADPRHDFTHFGNIQKPPLYDERGASAFGKRY